MENVRKEMDSNALDCRIYINENFAKADFDDWLFNQLNLMPNLSVMDLGCGTGKHLFKMSEVIGNGGVVVGLDMSDESLVKCQNQINEVKITNIKLIKSDLTKIKENIDEKFDRILASFSIYYTQDERKTLRDCYDALKDEGILFLCGPGKGNNAELLKLIEKADGTFSKDFVKWSNFLEETAAPMLKEIFDNVEILNFENPIEFPDKYILYDYWKSTALYDPKIDGAMRKVIDEEFMKKNSFVNKKMVIGLRCKKTSNICNFNLSHYKYCLELAKESGYEFQTMSEYVSKRNFQSNQNKKIITLRHDIDHNLKLVSNFANIEHNLGIRSTYFLRLHAKYSVMDLENYRVLLNLLEQGHEIGLHHDCDFASLVKEDPESFLIRDKIILEKIINKRIFGLSSHEPNKSKLIITDKDLHRFSFEYQAYSDIFLKEMKYISDSSSRWREGCMCNHIKKDIPKLCILTHPIWWFDKSPLENY